MKKIILTILFAFVSVNAQTATEIFGTKCAACHKENMPKEMSRKVMKALLAPPMSKISMKLKMRFKTQKEFVAFVSDYIANPSKDKAICSGRAVKNFGLMPAIGKSMTKKAREDIANWLYTNFKSDRKSCDAKTNHKCGNDKKMKCQAGKCGAK